MRRKLWYVMAMAAGLGVAPRSAWSDAIMVTRAMSASTIAEVFIDSDSIRVELEIGSPITSVDLVVGVFPSHASIETPTAI